MAFHLLGRIDFQQCLLLQDRLAEETANRDDRRIVVLVCEHPPLITVGRDGSRGHIRLSNEQLRRARIDVRWVARGGGGVLHAPGQLAVYPIAPIARCGWTVGQYLDRLHHGLIAAVESLGIMAHTRPPHDGLWGRTGLLAAVGVCCRRWVSRYGLYVNVHPAMSNFAFVNAAPAGSLREGERASMSSLLAEHKKAVRMPTVRTAVIEHLAAALGGPKYHLHTGHPWLPQVKKDAAAIDSC